MRTSTLAFVFALPLFAGCSALGLDDFARCDELGSTPAEQAAVCAQALNGSFGLPGWCSPWQCVEGRCVRTSDELCDAADNDCDGVVDEGVFAPTVVGSTEVSGSPVGLDGASGMESAWVRYVTSSAGAVSATVGTAITDVGPQEYRRHVKPMGDPEDVRGMRGEEEGCWELDLRTTGLDNAGNLNGAAIRPTTCRFEDLDVEMSGEVGLAVALDTRSSSDGLVRVGHVDATEPRRFMSLGPSALSNAYLGVARDGTQVRSALDPQACAEARAAASSVGTCPTDCAADEICLQGICAPRVCEDETDCGDPGLTCRSNVCTARSCDDDTQCGSLRCDRMAERCRQRCDDDADCGSDSLVCETSNLCVAKSCTSSDQCAEGDLCACGTCLDPLQVAAARACGVADVDLAVSNAPLGTGDQARLHGVVTMLGGSRERYPLGCVLDDVPETEDDESTREVALLGAWFQRSSLDVYSVVNVSDEGRPTVLGTTRSGSAPAAVAVSTGKFLVGFANADDDLSLRLVELPEARSVVVSSCEDPRVTSLPSPLPQGYFGTQTCGDPDEAQASLCVETRCGSDVGACTSGRYVCWGGQPLCEGLTMPRAEVCANGEDEDCDGAVDEDECIGACDDKSEICDAIDNDCDGRVDEGVGGETCTDAASVCGEGTTVCVGGQTICVGTRRDSRGEICDNGADDDCDGAVDEDTCPVRTCEPVNDVCDGTDNDCDGRIDENAPGQNQRTCTRDSDCGDRTCGPDGLCQSNTTDFRMSPPITSIRPTNRDPSVIRQCLETDPPMLGREFELVSDAEGRIEDLVMAVGPASPDTGVTVGFAWREVRGDDSVIRFRMVRFLADCTCLRGGMCSQSGCEPVLTPTDVRDPGMTVTLTRAGAVGAPSLVYVPSGVLSVGGPSREDAAVPIREGGGWHVLWRRFTSDNGASDGRVELRTIAAEDGMPSNASCDLGAEPCVQTVAGQSGNARFVDTFVRGGVPGFAWVDERTLEALTLQCGG